MAAKAEELTERRPLSEGAIKKGFSFIDHSLSLCDAMKIGENVLKVAKKINAMPLSITILDKSGKAKYVLNEDGTGLMRNDISFGKAWTSLSMGFPTRNLTENLDKRRQFLASLANVANGKHVHAPGGILILNNKKEVVGSMGISGDTSYRDEYLAIMAAQQCGFHTSPSKPHPNFMKSHL